MSKAVQDARQRLLDDLVTELEELSDRRDDLLSEMFRLVRYGESGNASVLMEDDDIDEGELEQFLERFDIRKNLDTGSILNLEIPELNLETLPSTGPPSTEREDGGVVQDAPQSDDTKYQDEEESLRYPGSSPVTSHTRLPKDAREDPAEHEAMDVDMPVEAVEPGDTEAREETPINIEDIDELEQQVEEQRTPPRTRARTRTASPIVTKRRKRRRSDVSDEIERGVDAEKLQVPSSDVRQTRSKSRKVTPPPPVVIEDDDVDELDIISLSSPTNVSPPRRRTSPRRLRSQSVQQEKLLAGDEAARDETAGIQEGGSEEAEPESTQPEEQEEPIVEEKFVPPSPTTPSTRAPSKAPFARVPSPPQRMESPIRAPKPKEPYIVDTTPLTPPKSPPPPIVVRLPISEPEKPIYNFGEEMKPPILEPEVKTENELVLPAAEPERPRALPIDLRFMKRPAFNYSLPPLSALPAEFNRKGKPSKSRKRDRERERSGSDSGKKDDWQPLGIAKWTAILQTNPVWRFLSRTSKCVTTKDWNTASTELRLSRTLDRIDVLKSTGKWSFRQLKKQRVAAGLIKTHWDYLMDEMKWMQVDFREERRWKIALAYELALSVTEWHEAGSRDERIRLGICARWRRPDPQDVLPINDSMDVDIAAPPASDDENHTDAEDAEPTIRNRGSTSDNEDQEVEDQAAVTAALIPDNVVVDANADVQGTQEEFVVPDPPEASTIAMKLEEIEGENALHLTDRMVGRDSQPASGHPRDVDNHWTEDPRDETFDASQALKATSDNPTMNPQPLEPIPAEEPKSLLTLEQTKLLRSSILSLPDEVLTISMDQLTSSDEQFRKSLAPDGDDNAQLDLTTVFPELQPFSLIDVPNSDIVGNNTDGRKKNDKKADKDDPTKRVDETTYNKLTYTSRFMHIKPTLVSALQPAKKWRKGRWIDLDESPVVSDVDSPPPLSGPENTCTLFEGRRMSMPFQAPLSLTNYSKLPRNLVKTQEIPWSQAEENLLKSLADRYPSNWRLVADALNSSRIRTSIDLRTPQECYERWRSIAGFPPRSMHPASAQGMQHMTTIGNNDEGVISNTAPDLAPPPLSSAISVGTSQMTTRGIKRLATTAAQNALNLTVHTGTPTVEMRKRKRHMIIYESVRKTLARRQKQRKQDEAKYPNAVIVPVHDSHLQLPVMEKRTPEAMAKMKADKEREELDAQLKRRREFEVMRQQQQQQLQAQLQQSRQQQQPTNHQGVALSQNVPQVRTQMMQQAQAAQQARVLQAQAQAQAQVQQAQSNHPQLQAQMAGAQPTMNGTGSHLAAQFANHGGASSPVVQHSSPPRSSATPVSSVANFPRPSSGQRNMPMQGAQVLPMASGSVPIARTNNALANYFANNGMQQYTQEHLAQLMRFQASQQQQTQMQQPQQQQLQLQLQLQASQQNAHQGGITGYPTGGQ